MLTPKNHLPWPADMYLEGGDQYRGWFHSSLLIGVGAEGRVRLIARPRPTAGRSTAKATRSRNRKGAEEAEKIINKYGAEVLRLWTASVDFTEDVRLSDTILDRLIEAYRKLRNTFRYALGNLHDFDPEKDAVPVAEMLEIDRWILARTEDLVRRCRGWYDDAGVSQSLSRDLRFRDHRSERALFRRSERPPVHGGDAEPRAAQRADGAVSKSTTR